MSDKNTIWKAIAAQNPAGVIGMEGRLPWTNRDEMQWFKEKTTGHAVLIGRLTWESIRCRLLPNRPMIILTKTAQTPRPGVQYAATAAEAARICPTETLWVIGGRQVYQECLPLCKELWLSTVNWHGTGDTWFPQIPANFQNTGTVHTGPGFYVELFKQPKSLLK